MAFSRSFENDINLREFDYLNFDPIWTSMIWEFVDVFVTLYVAFDVPLLPDFHRLRQGAGPFGRLCAPGCGSVWPDWVLSESRKKGCVSPERRDSPLRLL